MIEKIPFETETITHDGKIMEVQTHASPYDLQVKINELVDAVNELQCKNVHIESDLQDLMYPKEIKGELGKNVQDEMPRCPFCGEELFYVQEIDGGFDILACNCSAGFWLFGNDKMWYNLEKATTELDRTRKALDVAVDALKEIDKTRSVANHKIGTQDKTLNSGIVFCWTTPDEIHNALEQITALEQKEEK